MSMQINVDPAALSQEQREAVAGFILAYPGKACVGTCGGHAVAEIHAHTHAAPVAGATTGPVVSELAVLQHDHESTLPVAAFGQPVVDEAAAAFGVPPAPLPLGATAVPFTAVAAPSLIVPAVTTVTTFAAAPNVPAPPAQNTAPAAPIAAPQTGSPVGAVDLDKTGLPWDNRIHAGTKRKNADGSWTAKRGVDPALVAAVEAELRQVMGVTPAAPLAPAVPAPQVTAPPAPAVAPAADARAQFVALVGRASAAIQGQKVTQAEVNQCCADVGVPALPLLANRLDLVAQVAAHIDALIEARQ